MHGLTALDAREQTTRDAYGGRGTAQADRVGHACVERENDTDGDRHDAYGGSCGVTPLGYEPRKTFEEGLAETVQWYRDNRAWWEPLKERAAL